MKDVLFFKISVLWNQKAVYKFYILYDLEDLLNGLCRCWMCCCANCAADTALSDFGAWTLFTPLGGRDSQQCQVWAFHFMMEDVGTRLFRCFLKKLSGNYWYCLMWSPIPWYGWKMSKLVGIFLRFCPEIYVWLCQNGYFFPGMKVFKVWLNLKHSAVFISSCRGLLV